MAKLTSLDKIIDRADERAKHLTERLEHAAPPGHRRATEREQVTQFLRKTAEDHCQGVLEHGPKAYGEYLARINALKRKYDRRG